MVMTNVSGSEGFSTAAHRFGPVSEIKPVSPCTVARAMMRFLGVVLALSAVGVWVVQTHLWDVEIVLVKLVVSVIFGTSGLAMLQVGRDLGADEFHIDAERHELRHVRRGCDGIQRVVATHGLGSLGELRLEGRRLTVTDTGGNLLIEADVRDAEAALALEQAIAAIRD